MTGNSLTRLIYEYFNRFVCLPFYHIKYLLLLIIQNLINEYKG